jgi:hypothetical protein
VGNIKPPDLTHPNGGHEKMEEDDDEAAPRKKKITTLTNEQIDDLLNRMEERWIRACLKFWSTAVVTILTGTAAVWGPVAWHWWRNGGHPP